VLISSINFFVSSSLGFSFRILLYSSICSGFNWYGDLYLKSGFTVFASSWTLSLRSPVVFVSVFRYLFSPVGVVTYGVPYYVSINLSGVAVILICYPVFVSTGYFSGFNAMVSPVLGFIASLVSTIPAIFGSLIYFQNSTID